MTGSHGDGRVLVVVGTRPEAIKMAPVIRSLRERKGIDTKLALTGQHSELVDEALSVFSLVPDWDLEIMREGQSPIEVGRACLAGVQRVVEEWRPDLVLVQGDTASVFFASLTAFLHGIPCGHVEAGLRSGDLRQPFPEEGFRRLTTVLADLHFAPTTGARQNLLDEGVKDEIIEVTGNPIVDALLEISSRDARATNPELAALLRADGPPFLLLTAHRRESFGPPIEGVFRAAHQIIEEHDSVELLFPVHPNPAVVEPAHRLLGGHPRIHLVTPLSYIDLVLALRGACGVLTDSGGIQEEAPTFGTPVLVLREVTERPEGIEAGVARLVGTDPTRILEETRQILHALSASSSRGQAEAGRDMGDWRRANPYGDGRAAERIAQRVQHFLRDHPQREAAGSDR